MYEVIDSLGNVDKIFRNANDADEYCMALLKNSKIKLKPGEQPCISLHPERINFLYANGYIIKATSSSLTFSYFYDISFLPNGGLCEQGVEYIKLAEQVSEILSINEINKMLRKQYEEDKGVVYDENGNKIRDYDVRGEKVG